MNTKLEPELNVEPKGKRDQIIQAARALFAHKRFDEVSVPEIVSLAGVAQGTFYRYFTSKNALVDVLVADFSQAIVEAIAPILAIDEPLTDRIGEVLRRALEATMRYQDILSFLATDATLFGETPEGETQRVAFRSPLVSNLERDQARGWIRADADVRVAARLVDACLLRVARDCALTPTGVPIEAYIQETATFLRAALEVKSNRSQIESS